MPTEGLSEENRALMEREGWNLTGWSYDAQAEFNRLLDAARAEGPAPPGGGVLGQQPFERHPRLAAWIERLANTDLAWSLGEWGDFLSELNAALTQPETPDHG